MTLNIQPTETQTLLKVGVEGWRLGDGGWGIGDRGWLMGDRGWGMGDGGWGMGNGGWGMGDGRGFIKVLNRRANEFDTRAKNWQGPEGLSPLGGWGACSPGKF